MAEPVNSEMECPKDRDALGVDRAVVRRLAGGGSTASNVQRTLFGHLVFPVPLLLAFEASFVSQTLRSNEPIVQP